MRAYQIRPTPSLRQNRRGTEAPRQTYSPPQPSGVSGETLAVVHRKDRPEREEARGLENENSIPSMPYRFLTILTGRNLPKIRQLREPEPSIIQRKDDCGRHARG